MREGEPQDPWGQRRQRDRWGEAGWGPLPADHVHAAGFGLLELGEDQARVGDLADVVARDDQWRVEGQRVGDGRVHGHTHRIQGPDGGLP